MRLGLLFLGLAFGLLTVSGATISGKDSTYAGVELEFLVLKNPITKKDSVLAKTTVGQDGTFTVNLDIQETLQIYLYPGIHKLYLFVEPGKEYRVILPAFQPKTISDQLNPYYKSFEAYLVTEDIDEDDLNIQIRMFLDTYNPYSNKHLNKKFKDKEFEQLDKDIEQMDKPFSKSKNRFFNEFREYKYGMLRFIAYQHKPKVVSDTYFKGKPFLYKNPAYFDLFSMLYDQYFIHFSRGDESKLLVKAFTEEKTYTAVHDVLASDDVLLPDELLNMVLLKNLYDEFYDDNYSRSSLLEVLDSFIESVDNPVQNRIAREIREKVTKLLVGFEPPQFKLYNTDSILVSLDNFKGKHIYLNFCSCFGYACLNEFVMLENLKERHKDYLTIISIVIDDDIATVRNFIEKSGYSWTFLHFGNQQEIIEEYDIRAFPTYFLLDQQGKLVLSPAPSPAEGFEVLLFKELKAKGVL